MAGKRSQRSSTLKVLAWKLIVGLGSVYVNYVQARPKFQIEPDFESNDKILLILRPFYQSSSHYIETIRINAIAPPCSLSRRPELVLWTPYYSTETALRISSKLTLTPPGTMSLQTSSLM
jgi:hypothetical protein